MDLNGFSVQLDVFGRLVELLLSLVADDSMFCSSARAGLYTRPFDFSPHESVCASTYTAVTSMPCPIPHALCGHLPAVESMS